MRGSNEPELSITRTKDLDQFIRECDAFQLDRGHIIVRPGAGAGEDGVGGGGPAEEGRLGELRRRFEELLGNANG